VIAGAAMSLIMSKMAGRGQVAYAEAGNVVEQTVGAIRTVSFLFFSFSPFQKLIAIFLALLGSSVYGRETSNGKIRKQARDRLQDSGSTGFDLWFRPWYNVSRDLLQLRFSGLVWCKADNGERLQWRTSHQCDFCSLDRRNVS